MKAQESCLLSLSSPLNLGLFGHAGAPLHLESWKMSPLRLFSGLLVGRPWEARGETGLNPAILKRLGSMFPVPPEQHAEDGSFFIPSSRCACFWKKVVAAPVGCAGPSPFLSSQVSRDAVNLLGAPTQPSSDVGEDFSFHFSTFWGENLVQICCL